MIYKTKAHIFNYLARSIILATARYGFRSLSHHHHNIMCTVHCADRLLAKETTIKSYHELVRLPHAVPLYNTNANKAQHKNKYKQHKVESVVLCRVQLQHGSTQTVYKICVNAFRERVQVLKLLVEHESTPERHHATTRHCTWHLAPPLNNFQAGKWLQVGEPLFLYLTKQLAGLDMVGCPTQPVLTIFMFVFVS